MKNINPTKVFGSLIVSMLLLLYAYSLIDVILYAWGVRTGELNEGITRTLATVGGLVSALVIAQLANTQPGGSPVAKFLVTANGSDGNADEPGQRTAELLTAAYILIWVLLGLFGFVVGEMWYPGKVPALTDFAQAWLGLAVAAGYSYFGIQSTK